MSSSNQFYFKILPLQVENKQAHVNLSPSCNPPFSHNGYSILFKGDAAIRLGVKDLEISLFLIGESDD